MNVLTYNLCIRYFQPRIIGNLYLKQYNTVSEQNAGLLWIFFGEGDEYRGRYQDGVKKRKIPIVAYRHVLITECHLTPTCTRFQTTRPSRPWLARTATHGLRRHRTKLCSPRTITASRTGFDFITVRLRFPSSLQYHNVITTLIIIKWLCLRFKNIQNIHFFFIIMYIVHSSCFVLFFRKNIFLDDVSVPYACVNNKLRFVFV